MYITEPDYLQMWNELVTRGKHGSGFSYFDTKHRAEQFDAASRNKNRDKRDVLFDFVKSELKSDDSVLDIGAGTGRWSVPLAKVTSRVTAVEPASPMSEILFRNASEAGVREKITVVSETWEDADVAIHDIVTCFHSIYMSADFSAFVRKMESHAERSCYLGLRHFRVDGIIQELSARIYGTRHDSPNFIVAYNALCQMGISANVRMEDFRRSWTDDTVDNACVRAKRHLHIEDRSTYDELVRETMERRLAFDGHAYAWPDGMTTALAWWRVDSGRAK